MSEIGKWKCRLAGGFFCTFRICPRRIFGQDASRNRMEERRTRESTSRNRGRQVSGLQDQRVEDQRRYLLKINDKTAHFTVLRST